MKRIAVLTLALALPVGLAACGDDDGTGPEDGLESGTFTATVSGDLTGEFGGQAAFGEATDPETGQQYWVLILTSGSENSGHTLYFGRMGSRPGTGTVSVSNVESEDPEAGELFALYFDFTSQTSYGLFGSTGGSLSVTESSGSDMSGTFSIQATGTTVQGSEPVQVDVTVNGEFNAESGNVGLPSVF